MNKKTKRFVLSLMVIVTITLLGFGIKFIIDSPYRKNLPANTDVETLVQPLSEQILNARMRVYIFTTSDNLGRLGMLYYSAGDYLKAAQCFKLAIKKDNEKWIWKYYLGYVNLEQGELNTAIDNFREVVAKDAGNHLALYYIGEAYQKLGSIEKAEKVFSDIASANDTENSEEKKTDRENYFSPKTYSMFQLARIYMNSNRLDSAESTLKQIIKNELAFGPSYRLLGNVYKLKGDSSLSIKYSVRANDLADYNPPADRHIDEITLLTRFDQYLLKRIDDGVRSNNFLWALKLCEHAVKYYPDNKYVISNAFFLNLRQNKKKEALCYLDRHFRYFSNDTRELMDAMDELYNNGLYDEALKYFHRVQELIPENPSLAMWLYERGKKPEAVVLINEQIRNHPKNEKILGDIIRLLLDMGDEELAQKYFTNLKLYAPFSTEVLQIKGLYAEREGDMKAALLLYEEAFRSGAKDLLFMKGIINAYLRNHNWQEAIRMFRTSLESYPNDPELLEGYGTLLIACPDATLRNIDEGLEYAERAFININSAYKTKLAAGKSLATVYVSLGDKKNAVLFINKTIDLAREKNLYEEYVAYFQNLVSKRQP